MNQVKLGRAVGSGAVGYIIKVLALEQGWAQFPHKLSRGVVSCEFRPCLGWQPSSQTQTCRPVTLKPCHILECWQKVISGQYQLGLAELGPCQL